MLNAPSAYVDGYTKARAVDREAADNYIVHTRIGDPVMDAVVEENGAAASGTGPQVHPSGDG